ncbi:MAG TPA: putative porin, partial [Flavitalea sp.]|nr:putative porin [Flavitalea sp.]
MQRPFYIFTFFFLFLLQFSALAQDDAIRRIQGAGSRYGRGATQGKGDSILHRTGLEDSITIRFRFLDSSRLVGFDSSISDFTNRFPIPWHHVHLGNLGNATNDLIFSPSFNPGWDIGFHAYDVYKFKVEETRFYTTTRPYSEVGYLLGSQAEQMIHLLHTQNIRPNWNASFQYRLINAPGFFQNQNTNHNNYRFGSWYSSRNKRYNNFIIALGNKLQSSENGGILSNGNYLDSIDYRDDRFKIPTNLNVGSGFERRNFFNSNVKTGTKYTTGNFLMRQQYDLGQKDSIVTDSTVVPLFYPRLRFEHTIQYNTYNYRFEDRYADSAYYKSNYNIQFDTIRDTFIRRDKWHEMINYFSIYT